MGMRLNREQLSHLVGALQRLEAITDVDLKVIEVAGHQIFLQKEDFGQHHGSGYVVVGITNQFKKDQKADNVEKAKTWRELG